MRRFPSNVLKEVIIMAMFFLEIVAFLSLVSSERIWSNVMEQEDG